MAEFDTVPLDSVRINGGTQSRAELSQSTIAEYTEAIRLSADLPPVVMFFDGAHFWLADGFHRYHAHREAGAIEISAEIRTGTQRDAVLYSVGANASHGLRRSNEDKRKAVETLLADPEWATWSNNAIAKACAVSDKTVAAYRADHLRKSEDSRTTPAVRKVERNGSTYEQNTAKIGKALAPAAATAQPPATAAQPLPISPTNTPAAAPAPAAAEAASLVQQVLDQQSAHAVSDEEQPAPDAEAEVDPVDQLLADLHKAVAERDELRATVDELKEEIKFLTQDDMAAQAQHWKSSFEGISGRNAGLIKKLNEIEPEFEQQTDLLLQIHKALGVERNRDILPALSARRAA